ncbi:melatonin receptor type 1A-like [Oculina patagonica]
MQREGMKPLAVIESVFSGIILVCSFIGNFLIILVVFKKPRLGTATSIYIASLAVTDFLNACIPGPLFLASLITEQMPYNSVVCNIGGFFIHFLTMASTSTMALIAINRYYCTLKPSRYKIVFSTRRSVFYLMSLWTFVAIFTWIPVIGGWAKMAFNPLMACCNWRFFLKTAEMTFTLLVVVVFIITSFLIIAVSYYHVSRYIRQHNNQFATHHGLSAQEINLTKTFFVLVLSFVVMWLPTFTVIFLYRVAIRETYPRLVGIAVPFLFQVNSALNPWIYGIMNPSFRKKLTQLLKWSSVNQVHCESTGLQTGHFDISILENGNEENRQIEQSL